MDKTCSTWKQVTKATCAIDIGCAAVGGFVTLLQWCDPTLAMTLVRPAVWFREVVGEALGWDPHRRTHDLVGYQLQLGLIAVSGALVSWLVLQRVERRTPAAMRLVVALTLVLCPWVAISPSLTVVLCRHGALAVPSLLAVLLTLWGVRMVGKRGRLRDAAVLGIGLTLGMALWLGLLHLSAERAFVYTSFGASLLLLSRYVAAQWEPCRTR